MEKGILGDSKFYPSTNNPYNFNNSLFVTVIAASLFGAIIGSFEVLYFNKFFSSKSFLKKIIYKIIFYLTIVIFFLICTATISFMIEFDTNILDKEVWINLRNFITNLAFLSVLLYIITSIGISLFYLEVSDNIGQEVLFKFFTGKYHKPIEEERIFMFLDMKSSTTIAEKLGHVKYFEMLAEYYADLSDAIIQHSGIVYQYVGDEIVVSWSLSKGLKTSNCIHCFYSMQKALTKQSSKYLERFGVLPTFKAGFHYGKITAGEIGTIKKDIVFTGDVLNTTARIQGLCNSYEVVILISDTLTEQLKVNTDFKYTSLGMNSLRGKHEQIELFTIA
ncbi:adenylate/guanylate cyclase domain-containing protein [Aquimarina sp. 2201CG14-23]|uniref:adenylate/guanylate cyclase domain-containing protein n=1 Tax=Aquimarina mycalae TaxID=3040073 RepID=UPI002477D33F|nr:adenylate/guanylate cyclase domain-containing protein [Aquimarina sp. 2201CG14-23]MDH7445663.1 adenylate/guanylate cyclase domain-containing protein [Aquimarina sp. 2201CG14-23]